MLKTKSLISQLEDVPREWVFEFYLKLDEKLTGQDVMIKSPFNRIDKNPSMHVFYSTNRSRYLFRDFSTGKSGDSVTMVKDIFSLTTKGEASHKIIEDYNKFILTSKEDYSLREFKVHQRYKVTSHVKRGWTNLDQRFWTKFHIGSRLLERYHVAPLESYTMSKEEDGEDVILNITGHYLYGYFRADGTLYKIYQPMVKDHKFIKVKDYIQGSDQLTMKVPYLGILSSLKDMMAFEKLGFKNVEVIAPDSENTLIPEHVITAYKAKYKAIFTLFDNDAAGIESMKKYEEKYEVPGVILPMAKDISDSGKDHGLAKVREEVTPLLKKALTWTKDSQLVLT